MALIQAGSIADLPGPWAHLSMVELQARLNAELLGTTPGLATEEAYRLWRAEHESRYA